MRDFEAVKEVLKSNPAGKSPKQIADVFNCSLSSVYRMAEDPETSGLPITLSRARQLTYICKDNRLAQYIALPGSIIITLPEEKSTTKSITRSLAKTLKEFADVVDSSSKALLDGKVTDEERKRIGKQVDESISAMLRYKEVVKNG